MATKNIKFTKNTINWDWVNSVQLDDYTAQLGKRTGMSKELCAQRVSTALHEAAHCLVHIMLGLGIWDARVSTREPRSPNYDHSLGSVRTLPPNNSPDIEAALCATGVAIEYLLAGGLDYMDSNTEHYRNTLAASEYSDLNGALDELSLQFLDECTPKYGRFSKITKGQQDEILMTVTEMVIAISNVLRHYPRLLENIAIALLVYSDVDGLFPTIKTDQLETYIKSKQNVHDSPRQSLAYYGDVYVKPYIKA